MNKRGVSAIVATVLIVLVTVAGVTILWTVVIPFLNIGSEFSAERVDIVTSEGYTVYDERGYVAIQVKRAAAPQDSKLQKVQLVLSFNGTSISHIVDAPKPNENRIYCFNLSEYSDKPQTVKAAPTFVRGNSWRQGVVTSDVKLSEGTLVNLESCEVIFGYGDCVDGVKRTCGSDQGECNIGNETCIERFWEGVCTDNYVGPQEEICNNLDEDCDGQNDNGLTCECTGGTRDTICGLGICSSTGIESCVNGFWDHNTDTCIAGISAQETCNNVDDDCDGLVDNIALGILGQTSCGVGACARTVDNYCVNGQVQSSCEPGTPSPEICSNGRDDDCDGYLDCSDSDCSDNINCLASCTDADGDGYCLGNGVNCNGQGICTNGYNDCNDTVFYINPGRAEVCSNGIDDNCDGLKDCEDPNCHMGCFGTIVGSCGMTISSPGTYYLTSDLILNNSVRNCITVSANNVTIDGDGHSIIFRDAVGGVNYINGVYLQGDYGTGLLTEEFSLKNFTLRNLGIKFDSTVQTYGGGTFNGVYLNRVDNFNISHNEFQIGPGTLEGNIHSVYLDSTKNGLVANNKFRSPVDTGTGIYMTSGTNNNISGNNLTNPHVGIYAMSGEVDYINNNIIMGARTYGIDGNSGILLQKNKVCGSSEMDIHTYGCGSSAWDDNLCGTSGSVIDACNDICEYDCDGNCVGLDCTSQISGCSGTGGMIPISSCGVTINSPGQYYLTRDLFFNRGSYSACITVNADNVKINGNCKKLFIAGGDVLGISVTSPDYNDPNLGFELKNLNLFINGAGNNQYSNKNNYGVILNTNKVGNFVISNNFFKFYTYTREGGYTSWAYGIKSSAYEMSNGVISSNRFLGYGPTGIMTYGIDISGDGSDLSITNNEMDGLTYGMFLNSRNLHVANNNIYSSIQNGLQVYGNGSISGNRICDSGQHDIYTGWCYNINDPSIIYFRFNDNSCSSPYSSHGPDYPCTLCESSCQ